MGGVRWATDRVKLLAARPQLLLCSAGLGLAVNLLSYLIIQLTSAVMLKAIGAARTAGLVLFCAFFLGEEVTQLQFVGYGVSLAAFAWYNYLTLATQPPAPVPAPAASSRGSGALV